MLQVLYDYGARKMVLFGIGTIGCSPSELAQNSPDGKTCTKNQFSQPNIQQQVEISGQYTQQQSLRCKIYLYRLLWDLPRYNKQPFNLW